MINQLLNLRYLKPIWKVALDGQDLTGKMAPRLMSLTITESRSDEADQMDITLSDADGQLEIPKRNAKLAVAIGFEQSGLVEKGEFHVDEVEHRGAPDQIIIRARSAAMDGALRTRTERSFHKKKIIDIVKTIAVANKLEAVVDKYIGSKIIDHIDQTNESDLAFLNRLGKRYDVVATVKEGKLLFILTHGGKKASGEKMPIKTIYRAAGDQHSFIQASRDNTYTGVTAFWMEPRKSTRKKVVYGAIGNAKQLRETYGNEKDALEAAKAEWQRIQRGEATMKFSMAHAIPELSPQYIIQFPDMKKPISEKDWLIKTITHKLDDGGLTSDLDLELVGE